MEYAVRLKIDIYAPDDVLKSSGETYHSMERTIKLRFVPFPGLLLSIKPTIDERRKAEYQALFSTVTQKTGIFEVELCVVEVDSDSEYDLVVMLKGKSEKDLQGFRGLKKFLEFYGFMTVRT